MRGVQFCVGNLRADFSTSMVACLDRIPDQDEQQLFVCAAM